MTVIHAQAEPGPSYAEVVKQRDIARAEADLCHRQCVDLITSTGDAELGWKLIVAGAFAIGAILGAVSVPLAAILVGSVTP